MRTRRPAVAAASVLGCALSLAVPTAASASGSSGAAAGTAAVAKAAVAAGRSLCAPPADTVGPVATSVSFGQPTIDLDSGSLTQTVTVDASDTSGDGAPSGVRFVYIRVEGNRFYSGAKLKLTSGTATSGEWTGQFDISKYSRPGTYTVEYLTVEDAAGNDQEYSGYRKTPSSPYDLSLHPELDPTFEVTGTPATPPARKPSGDLVAFGFGPRSVDTTAAPQRVHVHAVFDGPAPTRVEAEFSSDRHQRKVRHVYLHANLHETDGTWAGSIRVPQWLGTQTLQAEVYARWGRRFKPDYHRYDYKQLRRLEFPTDLSVTSGVDDSRPELTSLTLTPDPVDSTDGPVQLTVTAQATDVGSGVKTIEVSSGIEYGINGSASGLYIHAGVGYISSDHFHVALTQDADGDWVGTTKIQRCVPSGTWKLDASLRDAAGNYRNYSTKTLAKDGLTSTVEVTSQHGDIVAPDVYSAATESFRNEVILNFSEGVANVTPQTLTLYPIAGDPDTRYTTTADITGIDCYSGKSEVDCSGTDGLVTSAIVTLPDIEPGDKYQVYANQDGVTSQLVDGNGNPMRWGYQVARVKGA